MIKLKWIPFLFLMISLPKSQKNTKLYITIYAATGKSNVDHFSRLILSENAVFKTGFKTRPVI